MIRNENKNTKIITSHFQISIDLTLTHILVFFTITGR
jgi:hypothetical protein